MTSTLFLAIAVPQIAAFSWTQPDATRKVSIQYTIADAPAIVMVDVQTNGVSIGRGNFLSLDNQFHRLVAPGTYSLQWDAKADWPDQKLAESEFSIKLTAISQYDPPDWMLVNLEKQGDIVWHSTTNTLPYGDVTNAEYKTSHLLMRRIHSSGVAWRMGSLANETGRTAARETPHIVQLSDDYYISIYQITQKQFEHLSGYNRAQWYLGDTRPHNNRNYNALRGSEDEPALGSDLWTMRRNTGIAFDLPTDAQWEFACRAGTTSMYNDGSNPAIQSNGRADTLNLLAWYGGIAMESDTYNQYAIKPVGMKRPNAWGLFDMHGNGWEICRDWFVEDLGAQYACDPTGPSSGTTRVVRGGGTGTNAAGCRSAYRSSIEPDASMTNGGLGAYTCRLVCPVNLANEE